MGDSLENPHVSLDAQNPKHCRVGHVGGAADHDIDQISNAYFVATAGMPCPSFDRLTFIPDEETREKILRAYQRNPLSKKINLRPIVNATQELVTNDCDICRHCPCKSAIQQAIEAESGSEKEDFVRNQPSSKETEPQYPVFWCIDQQFLKEDLKSITITEDDPSVLLNIFNGNLELFLNCFKAACNSHNGLPKFPDLTNVYLAAITPDEFEELFITQLKNKGGGRAKEVSQGLYLIGPNNVNEYCRMMGYLQLFINDLATQDAIRNSLKIRNDFCIASIGALLSSSIESLECVCEYIALNDNSINPFLHNIPTVL